MKTKNYTSKVQKLNNEIEQNLIELTPALIVRMEELYAEKDKRVKIESYDDTRRRFDLTMSEAIWDYGRGSSRGFKHIIIDQFYGHDTMKFGDSTWVCDITMLAKAQVLDYINNNVL